MPGDPHASMKTVTNGVATARHRLIITPELAMACIDFVDVLFTKNPQISELCSGLMLEFLELFATWTPNCLILGGPFRDHKKIVYYVCWTDRGSPFDNKTGHKQVLHKSPGAHTQRGRSYGLCGPFGSLPGPISWHFGPISDQNSGLQGLPGSQGSKIQ